MNFSKFAAAFTVTSVLSSPAFAETAILTASAGYEGGVTVSEIYVENEQGCLNVAYTAAAALSAARGGHTSVLCMQTTGRQFISSYVCTPPKHVESRPACNKLEMP